MNNEKPSPAWDGLLADGGLPPEEREDMIQGAINRTARTQRAMQDYAGCQLYLSMQYWRAILRSWGL